LIKVDHKVYNALGNDKLNTLQITFCDLWSHSARAYYLRYQQNTLGSNTPN